MKKFAILALVLSICLVQVTYGQLDDINNAIKQKNAKWVAAETNISQLNDAQRAKLMGVNESRFAIPSTTTRFVGNNYPDFFDWRDDDGVTPIKNQANCGSCWAFAGVAALESLLKVKGAPFYNLSEQYLLSCSEGDCGGWWVDLTADFIRDEGTILETELPYEASAGVPCPDTEGLKIFKIDDWKVVANTEVDPKAIMPVLVTCPLATTMGVYSDFLYYKSGIYSHVDGMFVGWHAILLIGYDANQEYWIAKNSWGTEWGEQGYFRIAWGESYFGEFTQIYILDSEPAVSPKQKLPIIWAAVKTH